MWQNDMVRMLRHYIGDLDCPPTYDDYRLQECLLISAMQVSSEVDLSYSYDISLDILSITPDPTEKPTTDPDFCLLSAYLAASIIAGSEFRSSSGKNIMVSDGGSQVDMRYVAQQKQAVYKFYLDGYQQLKLQYGLNNLALKAIISPASTGFWGGGYYQNYGVSPRYGLFGI
jgi:hypothetical protein